MNTQLGVHTPMYIYIYIHLYIYIHIYLYSSMHTYMYVFLICIVRPVALEKVAKFLNSRRPFALDLKKSKLYGQELTIIQGDVLNAFDQMFHDGF